MINQNEIEAIFSFYEAFGKYFDIDQSLSTTDKLIKYIDNNITIEGDLKFCGIYISNYSVFSIDFDENISLSGFIPQKIQLLNNLQWLSIRYQSNLDFNLLYLRDMPLLKNAVLDCSFSGNLQYSLRNLKSLKNLDIYTEKKIGGAFPLAIGDLTNLEKLKLIGTGLEGSIPHSIVNCQSLKIVHLRKNSFHCSIPHEFFGLMDLRDLYLEDNGFYGSLPDSIGELKKLHALEIINDSLSGKIPHSLFQIPVIRDINLQNNQLSGGIDSSVLECKKLQRLSVEGNRMDEIDPLLIEEIKKAGIYIST